MFSFKPYFFSIIFLFLGYIVKSQETLQSVTENGPITYKNIGLWGGGSVANNTLKIDGYTMGTKTPLTIYPNDWYVGILLNNAAMHFETSNDQIDGGPTRMVFHYPNSGIPYFRRDGKDHTILKIWSPKARNNAYESTLALVNGDEGKTQEFLDLYNMNYPTNRSYGIRMQKRNGGEYKPFHFEYSDGPNTYPVMTLNSDKSSYFYGDIGVGTTDTQGYKLAVHGDAIAESLTVKLQGNWPDYVFSKNYQLASLDQIEKYVKVHKRLPDVPSAREIKENGMNLGEINKITMEKVEEIYLYLIEQNKKIKELQVKNRKLRKIIENE